MASHSDPQPLAGTAVQAWRLSELESEPVPPQEPLEITVHLRATGRSEQQQRLQALLQPGRGPREFLTHAEVRSRHGIRDEDLAAIERFAREHAWEVVDCDRLARLVRLRADAATAAATFRVRLRRFAHRLGNFRGHAEDIQLPRPLVGLVEGVFGLDTAPLAIPHTSLHPTHRQSGVPPNPADVLHYTPPQLAQLYQFPADQDGSGVCVALLSFSGGYKATDLASYFQRLGLKPPVIQEVHIDQSAGQPTGDLLRDGEVTLDIEVLGGVAPGANLLIYHAPNTTEGWIRAVHRVVSDETHKPAVLSISWGQVESRWPPAAIQAMQEALTTASLLGITVCASAGDHGAADGQTTGAHVNYPASSPLVLACGGTELHAADGTIQSEVVWNELGNPHAVFPGATGGGISDLFPLPSYQSEAQVPASANDGQTRGRGVPDVAANADPSSGYLVTVDGVTTVSGGTSAAAPLWAGLVARLIQASGKRLGLLHPRLYKAPGPTALRPITQGNNGAYAAGPGWNPCAGWGSPHGERLKKLLAD